MTHPLVKDPSWSLGENLTSTQANEIQNQLSKTIQEGANTLEENTSATLGAWDFEIDQSGAGRMIFTAAYPSVHGVTVTDWIPPM